MSRKIAAVLSLCLAAGSWNVAVAQSGRPEKPVPEAGANSFTENQAKDRIEKAGFTEVTGLRKDDQGIWRGRAKRGDQQVNVALDFRGNVTTQ
jgi:hypothetical protein